MLLQGTHVQRNPSKALTYFQRALDRGVAASANALGVMHAVGLGVPASMVVARSWFEQGANMSSSGAFYNLGTIYLHGKGQQQCCVLFCCCCSCSAELMLAIL
jgi:TPR repeat protein